MVLERLFRASDNFSHLYDGLLCNSQRQRLRVYSSNPLGRMNTAVIQLYFCVALSIANVCCFAISSFQPISQSLSLHIPASSSLHNVSTLSYPLSLIRHHHSLKAGLTFECDSSYGRNLEIDSVMTAWRHIPRDKEPMTFAHKREPDVHLPKGFLGRMYRVHLHKIQELY